MENATRLDRRALLGGLAAGLAAGSALASPSAARAAAGRALRGVFPIAFTPANPDGSIDFDGLASQVRFMRRGGVHGVAWPQIASGWTTLNEQDRITGAEAMVGAAKGGKTAIVIGVQSREADIAETIRYATHAEKIGADAVIGIPPPGVTAPAELLAYYQRIAQATSLPLFAQAVGPFSVDLLVQMTEAIPTFGYVKDETGDPLQRVTEMTRRTNGRLKSFSGFGVATMITEMERGFTGHCPFVSLSDMYASAFDLFHAGNRRAAYDQFGRIQAANSMMAQNNINILVARGVLKPGVTMRIAQTAAGSNVAKMTATTPDEIRRVLDTYLRPHLRA